MTSSTLAHFPHPLLFPFFVEAVSVALADTVVATRRSEALQKSARQDRKRGESQQSAHLLSPADAFAGQSIPAKQSGVICLMASRFATLDCSIDVAAVDPRGFCNAYTAAPVAIAATATSKPNFALDMVDTPYDFCSMGPSLSNANSDHSGMEGLRKGALPAGVANDCHGQRSSLRLEFIPSYGLSSSGNCSRAVDACASTHPLQR